MTHNYWATFSELICTPFRDVTMIWGIVPLYFALLLNELTSTKANFRTAIQTGFSFIWAGVQWLWPYFVAHKPGRPVIEFNAMLPINLFVTFVVLGLGIIALYSGVRKHYPKYFSFLGYTRFSNYFMITIYPIQTHHLAWTWERLTAMVLFAVPIWLLLHFGLMPLRGGK